MQRTHYILLRCIQQVRTSLSQPDLGQFLCRTVLSRRLTTSPVCCHILDVRDQNVDEKEKQLTERKGKIFDEIEQNQRNKETFQRAVKKYATRHDIYNRGSTEFIYASAARMKEFNVHRDLGTYKEILNIFAKAKMVSKTAWQVELMHYPKQQQCAIDLMDQMELNGVIPDDQFGYLLKDIFGTSTYAFRKYQRMMYWMPKFRNANPYPMPYELPENPIELARLALARMSVDPQNKIIDFQTTQLGGADVLDETFVVSAQSPEQTVLLADHNPEKPVFVEGGFTVWLREKSLMYFTLKSDTTETYKVYTEEQDKAIDEFEYYKDFLQDIPFFGNNKKTQVMKQPTVHEQDDGTLLAMCITGTGSKNSLATWVKWLQNKNPHLSRLPVIFRLATPETGLNVIMGEEERRKELSREGEAF